MRGPDGQGGADHAARQIRGSALLFTGKLLALGLGMVVQVITVRYLAKEDFGAFAYAVSFVSVTSSIAAFGIDKAMSRLLPLYQERGDTRRVLGALALAIGTMTLIGAVVILAVYLGRDLLGPIADPAAIPILVVLVWLTPIQALDPLFSATFAALANPRAIFFRRHLLQPLMLLAVVAAVVVTDAGVTALAIGYLGAGLVGLVVYTVILVRLLRGAYLPDAADSAVVIPWRDVFSQSLPLLPSNVVFLIRTEFVVLLLQALRSTMEVADFRAVYPLARLNIVVLQSFTLLYVPSAARLEERRDRAGLEDLRWHSSAWVALISFPVFAATFSLAAPVVQLLYGDRYGGAGIVLAILALGFYVSALLGFGGLTLRAMGRMRFLLVADAVGAALSLGLYVMLIPPFGAVGAAIATTVTLVLQGLVYQFGLGWSTGLTPAARRYYAIAIALGAAAAALLAIQVVAAPPLWLGLGLVAGAWLLVLRSFRTALAVDRTFPEILRVPFAGRILLGGAAIRRGDSAGGSS